MGADQQAPTSTTEIGFKAGPCTSADPAAGKDRPRQGIGALDSERPSWRPLLGEVHACAHGPHWGRKESPASDACFAAQDKTPLTFVEQAWGRTAVCLTTSLSLNRMTVESYLESRDLGRVGWMDGWMADELPLVCEGFPFRPGRSDCLKRTRGRPLGMQA